MGHSGGHHEHMLGNSSIVPAPPPPPPPRQCHASDDPGCCVGRDRHAQGWQSGAPHNLSFNTWYSLALGCATPGVRRGTSRGRPAQDGWHWRSSRRSWGQLRNQGPTNCLPASGTWVLWPRVLLLWLLLTWPARHKRAAAHQRASNVPMLVCGNRRVRPVEGAGVNGSKAREVEWPNLPPGAAPQPRAPLPPACCPGSYGRGLTSVVVHSFSLSGPPRCPPPNCPPSLHAGLACLDHPCASPTYQHSTAQHSLAQHRTTAA